ncbi:hypothetical protein QA062_gp39 [Salmonella phage vB_SenS_SB3]|uniref:Uncharacterized protein n=3 Tax=Jerseyvirus TaxID=1910991 RepID=A0A5C0CDW9_9CAUD|nr:hypothetical protein QA018_gp06 [Salmonella phage SS5]YP_010748419.1 hypothetical protein QA062_gp39 [Salmonella phage vB_SenS_SB3]QDH44737.1 hypothetical protein [Salmonella phage SF4]QDH44820.1 hypothetical protein [Salmonella phage SF5]QDH44862.1 hypothetical protein [Salmonella phage SS4]QDH44969.1 hypothetical protein [Salmonella phage SS10]QDH45036.1 hypothetical protein [Salmonella phage SI2]QDH45056.1 hypothetical protein [Salmonella phage SF1]QEI23541.1 hypothetical protein [Sal
MKKLTWWLLAVPLILVAFIYYLMRALEKVGETSAILADRMLDSKMRMKYLAWRNRKFG